MSLASLATRYLARVPMLKFSDRVRHHFSRAENLAVAPEVFRNLTSRATGNTPRRSERGWIFIGASPSALARPGGGWPLKGTEYQADFPLI
jgi:hypothetical protein